jgi:hypothetical protein
MGSYLLTSCLKLRASTFKRWGVCHLQSLGASTRSDCRHPGGGWTVRGLGNGGWKSAVRGARTSWTAWNQGRVEEKMWRLAIAVAGVLAWLAAARLVLVGMLELLPRRLRVQGYRRRRWRLRSPSPPTAILRWRWWMATPACHWPSSVVSSQSTWPVGTPIRSLGRLGRGSPHPNAPRSRLPSMAARLPLSETPPSRFASVRLGRCCWSPPGRCWPAGAARSWCSVACPIPSRSWSRCSGTGTPGAPPRLEPGSAELAHTGGSPAVLGAGSSPARGILPYSRGLSCC